MIDEPLDYFLDHGYGLEVSNEIQTAYYKEGMNGIIAYAKSISNGGHDYTEEIVQGIKQWQKDNNETPEGIPLKSYTIKIEWNFKEENDDMAKIKAEEHISRIRMNDIETWISVKNELICNDIDNKIGMCMY